MEPNTRLGMNRTGIQSSPQDSQALLAAAEATVPSTPGDAGLMAELRQSYIASADPLGTVPIPATAKGVLKSGAKMLTGKRPQLFVDKLAERLAFERTGVRLYDALLTKYDGRAAEVASVPLQKLEQFRAEEAQHLALLTEALETLGADPTAQTPCADLVAVESMGLVQALSEPRTSFVQSLHAILVAELADHDGWEMLIAVAKGEGQKDLAERFAAAFAEEENHLAHVRNWLTELTLAGTRMGAAS